MKRTNLLMSLLALFVALCPTVLNAQSADYPICIGKDQSYTRTDRHLDYIVLESPADGRQQATIAAPRMPYTSLLSHTFKAKAGETLKVYAMSSSDEERVVNILDEEGNVVGSGPAVGRKKGIGEVKFKIPADGEYYVTSKTSTIYIFEIVLE